MPPRILRSEIATISDRHFVAILTLHTDKGPQQFGINDTAADELIDILARFASTTRKPS
jgi:hypothetical protein